MCLCEEDSAEGGGRRGNLFKGLPTRQLSVPWAGGLRSLELEAGSQ